MIPLVASVAVLLAGSANAFRLHYGAMRRQGSSSQQNGTEKVGDVPYYSESRSRSSGPDPVDWSFMTTDYHYVGRRPSVWGWLKRKLLSSRREFSDSKEELVKGHFCSTKAKKRDHTYYSGSLCYWLPEYVEKAQRVGLGIQWKGGLAPTGGMSMCPGLSGSGRCVKCSVCHNNARHKDRQVEFTVFEEEVSISGTCLKEKSIESMNLVVFERENPALVTEKKRCEGIQGEYNRTQREYDQNIKRIAALRHKVNIELPEKIRQQENRVSWLSGERSRQVQIAFSRRSDAQGNCRQYAFNGWYRDLSDHRVDTGDLVRRLPHLTCYLRPRPSCFDPSCQHLIFEWERDRSKNRECEQCKTATDRIKSAWRAVQDTERSLREAQSQKTQLGNLLSQARTDLRLEEGRTPALHQKKEEAEAIWNATKASCLETYKDYRTGLAKYMGENVPNFYNRSCEKECIEKTQGCGVLEGARRNDVTNTGGIDAVCRPPQASWVHKPFQYVKDRETELDQCNRIFKTQKPLHAQAILKSGWLWKKSRWTWGRWSKRFFVLESGDSVRSALLRYWDEDPSKSGAKETDKNIILWDAQSISKVSGSKYRWRDGTECMSLYHYYREYKLCVPGGTSGGATQNRDQWVRLIQPTIIFASK